MNSDERSISKHQNWILSTFNEATKHGGFASYHPEDEEIQNDADSEDEAQPSLGNILASEDAIYDKYVSVKPDGKLTKEGIKQVFEALDMEYTARAKRRRLKTPANKTSNDVSEVYSPPRVTEVAEATGLKSGWALDLTVNKEDGKPWDLSLPATQAEALKRQEEEAPELLIASPMCAAFSSLQNLNYKNDSARTSGET